MSKIHRFKHFRFSIATPFTIFGNGKTRLSNVVTIWDDKARTVRVIEITELCE